MDQFDVTREQIQAVLAFAARSLDLPYMDASPTSTEASAPAHAHSF